MDNLAAAGRESSRALEHTADIHHDLICLCKEGDRRAQEKLYRLYARPMLGVSMRILSNKPEAEDVLQESFVSVFNNLHRFEGRSSFGSWLKRIVINRSINQLKKKRIHFDDLDESSVEETEVEADVEALAYTVDDVKSALSLLPHGYRLVFTLYMFENLSHSEIAEQLGITKSTSKSQLNRAKKKLKMLITKS